MAKKETGNQEIREQEDQYCEALDVQQQGLRADSECRYKDCGHSKEECEEEKEK